MEQKTPEEQKSTEELLKKTGKGAKNIHEFKEFISKGNVFGHGGRFDCRLCIYGDCQFAGRRWVLMPAHRNRTAGIDFSQLGVHIRGAMSYFIAVGNFLGTP